MEENEKVHVGPVQICFSETYSRNLYRLDDGRKVMIKFGVVKGFTQTCMVFVDGCVVNRLDVDDLWACIENTPLIDEFNYLIRMKVDPLELIDFVEGIYMKAEFLYNSKDKEEDERVLAECGAVFVVEEEKCDDLPYCLVTVDIIERYFTG